MKSITLILTVVLFFSCSSKSTHKEQVISSDSSHSVFIRNTDGSQRLFFAKGKIEVKEYRSISKDITSDKVEWATDTSLVRVYMPTDTARTKDHKPIFLDSAKRVPKLDSGWKDFGPYDHSKAILTVIN